MTRYFDASALVKRYVRETGSVKVRRLLASGIVATSRLSEVEVASGIVRRSREGAFTTAGRDRRDARVLLMSVVHSNNSMQRTALRAAADAGR